MYIQKHIKKIEQRKPQYAPLYRAAVTTCIGVIAFLWFAGMVYAQAVPGLPTTPPDILNPTQPGGPTPIPGPGFPDATLFTVLFNIDGILTALLPVSVSAALLTFFWGMARFILRAGNENEQAKGRKVMLWGIIALFVIVSVWGIVRLLGEIFGVGIGGSCPPPQIGQDTVTACSPI